MEKNTQTLNSNLNSNSNKNNQCNFVLISGKNKGNRCKSSSSKSLDLCSRHSIFTQKNKNTINITVNLTENLTENIINLDNIEVNNVEVEEKIVVTEVNVVKSESEESDKISESDKINNDKQLAVINSIENKINDISPIKSKDFKIPPLRTIEDLRKIVDKLRKIKFDRQGSPEWFAQRGKAITASSAAELLVKDKTCDPYIKEFNIIDFRKSSGKTCAYNSRIDYYTKKCDIGTPFTGSPATRWGVKYEQVATHIYEFKNNIEIVEFGLINHPNISWLAASPDGITPDGMMLEIKCPYSRKITGIPPLNYWIQVQIQLEVTDLEECDFEECTFYQYEDKYDYYASSYKNARTWYIKDSISDTETYRTKDNKIKGVIGEIQRKGTNNNYEYEYIYPKINQNIDATEKEIWQIFNNEWKNKDEGYIFNKMVYWRLDVYSCVTIKRSREWFTSVKNRFKSCWNEILEFRNDPKLFDIFLKENCTKTKYQKLHNRLFPLTKEELIKKKEKILTINFTDSDSSDSSGGGGGGGGGGYSGDIDDNNNGCLIVDSDDEKENKIRKIRKEKKKSKSFSPYSSNKCMIDNSDDETNDRKEKKEMKMEKIVKKRSTTKSKSFAPYSGSGSSGCMIEDSDDETNDRKEKKEMKKEKIVKKRSITKSKSFSPYSGSGSSCCMIEDSDDEN